MVKVKMFDKETVKILTGLIKGSLIMARMSTREAEKMFAYLDEKELLGDYFLWETSRNKS